MDKKLYKFGMDWLNGVLPVSDVKAVFDLLEMFSSKLRFERWTLLNSGRYNYSRRYCLDGNMSIQLMYNPVFDEEGLTADMNHNNSGIFFSISGDGIRYLHSLGGDVSALNKLLFYFYRNSFKASRFDTYCDIFDDKNEIVPLIQEAFDYVGREQVGKPLIRTRLRRSGSALRTNFRRETYTADDGSTFTNCTLGHHGSTVGMFRCYNKRVEVADGRLSEISSEIFKSYDVEDYWYRLEYEMHKENAAACFDALMSRAEAENSPLCFEDIFYSVFERVFSIAEPRSLAQMSGHNLFRCPASESWASFAAELSSNAEYLVQFRGVPYIKCTLTRLGRNAENFSSYYYAIGQYLDTLTPAERSDFMRRAKEKFESKSRYNLLRDEIADAHNSIKELKRKVKSLVWQQLPMDFSIPDFS